MEKRSKNAIAVYCIALFSLAQAFQDIRADDILAEEDSAVRQIDTPETLNENVGHLTPSEEIFETPDGCRTTIQCSNTHRNARYRTADGTCNNLANSNWGQSGIPYIRYLPNAYGDGIKSPRGANRNSRLPSPRKVSSELSMIKPRANKSPISLMVMQWGQFLDHDLVFTPETEVEGCCDDGINLRRKNKECIRLNVTDDEFYISQNIRCLKLTRSVAVKRSCAPGRAREQINALTAYIDASQVYGSTEKEQSALRTFTDGLLKVGQEAENQTMGCNITRRYPFLPARINSDGHEELFAGDRRSIEQPGLTSMHTLFVRAHNDIALKLKRSCGRQKNCGNDFQIFEETRRIVGALIQHITYNEFLPQVLGSEAMARFNLNPLPVGSQIFETGYNDSLSASTPNVFGTAAYRFGHSLVPEVYNLKSKHISLAESFGNTDLTLTFGSYPSDFLRAIAASKAEGMDHFMAESITNTLGALPPFNHGSDLYARNIMRGRDHGIPSYNEWRKFCGESPVRKIRHLKALMEENVAKSLGRYYRSVRAIDLFPALISEKPENVGDGIVGPTLVCLLGRHFHALKFGDRYYYEGDSQPNPFSFRQLDVIKRTTLASLLCAYTDSDIYQRQAMVTVRPGNLLEKCSDILNGTVPDLVEDVFSLQGQPIL